MSFDRNTNFAYVWKLKYKTCPNGYLPSKYTLKEEYTKRVMGNIPEKYCDNSE